MITSVDDTSVGVLSLEVSRGSVMRTELSRFSVFGFDHFGIYAGNKEVIHFSDGRICKEPVQKFVEDPGKSEAIDIMAFAPEFVKSISLEESYKRAISSLGVGIGYNLFSCNCEHFALWCRTGRAISGQVFGSESGRFNATAAGSLGSIIINPTRLIGHLNNPLRMEKSRTILIDCL